MKLGNTFFLGWGIWGFRPISYFMKFSIPLTLGGSTYFFGTGYFFEEVVDLVDLPPANFLLVLKIACEV